MKQRFTDDQAELDAHFAERVRAYLELGETPEQALVSAREKFGETAVVVQELRRQRMKRHPLTIGALAGFCFVLCYAPLALPTHAALASWQSTSQQLGETGPSLLVMMIVEMALTVVPTALAAIWLGRAFPRQSGAIVLGMGLASIFAAPTHELLSTLIVLIPTVCWALYGLSLQRCIARQGL